MATPALTPRNVSLQIIPGVAGRLRVDTLDALGAALDVSSGYTLEGFLHVPSNSPNPDHAAQDLDANVSAAFDATGFTVTWTAAQATTIAGTMFTLSSSVGLRISDDAGTTKSLAAQGVMSLARDKQLQG